MNNYEKDLLSTVSRQVRLGRLLEWVGLGDMSEEEFCGWLLVIAAMRKDDPKFRERVTDAGSNNLKELNKIDSDFLKTL